MARKTAKKKREGKKDGNEKKGPKAVAARKTFEQYTKDMPCARKAEPVRKRFW